jgi:hypothetical protein
MMTAQVSATTMGWPYRVAGWAAITSGVVGILAFGFLMAALKTRGGGDLIFRLHDAGVILQFLLMIPVVFGLHALARPRAPGANRATLVVGVVALALTVLCLMLRLINVISDEVYMVPQGVLGIWFIVVNRLVSGVLPRGLTWLGTIVGLGLVLVGTFPLAYTVFVEPVDFFAPIPAGYSPPPMTTPNKIIHEVLLIGTFMGVATNPIWTLLVGGRLVRKVDHTSGV